VVETLRLMGRYWATPGFLRGGTKGALQTTFTRSVADVFGAKPSSAMLYEGDFVTTEIAKLGVYRVGQEARYFPWPGSDAVVAGGDAAVAFTSRPVTMALMAFLASPEAAAIMVSRGGSLSVNEDLSLAAYPDATTRSLAETLRRSGTLRFDLSDLTPARFGGGNGSSMWRLLQGYLAAPGTDPAVVAAQLEEAADKAYGVV
jgi:alpha-glucoside transport system substrate-binding protein